MTRQNSLAALTLVSFFGLAAACSDDGFIATNEIIDEDAASAGNAGSGTGGNSGSTSTGGAGGAAGGGSCTPGEAIDLGTCELCGVSRKICDDSGTFGAPVCEEQGECEAGAEESQPCDNCGTQTRTCDSTCTWGAFGACGGTGDCAPGTVAKDCISEAKVDPCRERVCGSDCKWGACGKSPGAVCTWDAGKNFQCCGSDSWQYCNSATCSWHPCASCNGCSAC
jgi:hypothetical protein